MKHFFTVLFISGLFLSSKSQLITYSFSTCGATGSSGPNQTQVNTAYAAGSLSNAVIVNNGIQTWTVPVTGLYRIEVFGAQGGNASVSGGLGASVTGSFNLNAGTVFKILVGQQGASLHGGGGSFVCDNLNVPYIIAGGGGGGCGAGGTDNSSKNGQSVNTGGNGAGVGGGLGGNSGNGGGSAQPFSAGAGAGLLSAGAAGWMAATGGYAFINGGSGAFASGNAGFGGGANGTGGIGGGGGGYSGGGAGSNSSNANGSVGGGGGSYNAGLNPLNLSGINSGDGKVWITRICNAAASPVNITSAAQQTLCSGSTASLSVSGTGTINWYASGSSNTSLGTGTSIAISTLSPGTYTYYAASTNTCTEGTRIPVTLTVFATPTLNISSNATLSCAGDQIMISVSGASTYTWSTGSNASTITVSPTLTTQYTVIGKQNGCTANAAITLSVKPLPQLSVTGNTHICIGQTTTLTINGASSYTWSTGVNTNSIVVSPQTNTNYLVVGTGTNGCMNDTLIKVNVSPVPTVQITGNNVICAGDSVLLTATGAHDYSWTSNGALTPTVYASPLSNTTITVIGFVSPVCSSTAGFAIQVNPSPSLQITASTTSICLGQSVYLSVTGAAGYTWSTGSNSNAIWVSPQQSTTYSVSGTNTAYCTSAKTISITLADCSSVSETLQTDILIFPQPVNSTLHFNLPVSSNCFWKIYTINGACLASGTSTFECIDVSNWPQGFYLIEVQSNRMVWHKKWIKQ